MVGAQVHTALLCIQNTKKATAAPMQQDIGQGRCLACNPHGAPGGLEVSPPGHWKIISKNSTCLAETPRGAACNKHSPRELSPLNRSTYKASGSSRYKTRLQERYRSSQKRPSHIPPSKLSPPSCCTVCVSWWWKIEEAAMYVQRHFVIQATLNSALPAT